MYEKKGDTEVHYAYDGDGNPRYIQTVALDGTVEEGYIVTSTRGDVIAIVDTAGNIVVNYTYDAWGNILSVTDQNGEAITSTDHIGNLNSLRYRSYYYDTDTGLYYLQSRYYDPEVRRFINADDVGILEEDQGSIIEHNLFAYCLNNPVNTKDSEGEATMVIGMVAAYTLTDYIISAGITIIVVQQVYKTNKKTYKVKKTRKIKKANSTKSSKKKAKKRVNGAIARRKNYNTRKKAKEAAKKAGGGKEPIHHPKGCHGNKKAHYHPNVKADYRTTPNGVSKHDHYNY